MTWLKPVLPLLLVLMGCQRSPEATAPQPSAPLPPSQAADPQAAPPLPTGLTPLPTAQQVVAAQPLGRVDPFLPVIGSGNGAGGGAPAAPTLPAGFRFSGVIRSGGHDQALVQFGAESGTLRPGDVGGRSTKLLPPGWAVGGIDVARGRLILRASGRAIPLSLDGQV